MANAKHLLAKRCCQPATPKVNLLQGLAYIGSSNFDFHSCQYHVLTCHHGDLNKHGTTDYQPSKDVNRVLTGGCESSLASRLDARHAIRRGKTFKRALFLERRLFQNIEDFFEAAAAC